MTPETLKRIEALRKHVCASCDLDVDEFTHRESWNAAIYAVLDALKADLDASSGERPEIQVGDWVLLHDEIRPVTLAPRSDGKCCVEYWGWYHPETFTEIRKANGRVWRRGGATS